MRKVSAVTARSVSGPAKEGVGGGGYSSWVYLPISWKWRGEVGEGGRRWWRGCDSPAAGEAVNR